jgi:citrate lyase subunit beta/citryl-CoA lyase
MEFRPRRSVLYIPGDKPRVLEKARELAADALILDLEDSVAPEAKSLAREQVLAAAGGYGGREIVIRINGLDSPWGMDDLAAAAASSADAILIPKVNGPEDLARARKFSGNKALWAMMETPRAVFNALSIADAKPSCLIIGTNDLLKETRMESRACLIPALTQIVLAARASGVNCVDGVFNDFRDGQGFAAECAQGRGLGMDGKTLIHPSQIDVANQSFAPSSSELEWAQKVVAAFALPEAKGKGVITVEGRMVERLHLEMAERILLISKAIS